MPHASQQPSFLYDRRSAMGVVFAVPQQLERHLAIETRIPRAIHVPEASLPDEVENPERAPLLARDASSRGDGGDAWRRRRRRAAPGLDGLRDESQLGEQLPVGLTRDR